MVREVLNHEILEAAILNCAKVSSAEELSELCTCLGFEYSLANADVSDSHDRKKADLDQYADEMIFLNVDESDVGSFIELSKVVPLRLEYTERKFLRLLEATLDSSEYTDRVDSVAVLSSTHQHRHTALVLKNICSLLSGLVIGHDSKSVDSVLIDRDFSKFSDFYRQIFEIGRRYKILNPERMRESYFKMMYLLQDLHRSDVSELFDFHFDKSVDTVYTLLVNSNGLNVLADPFIETATAEILPHGKTKWKVQEEIKTKEQAIKRLAMKYSSHKSRNFFSSKAGDEDDDKNALTRDQVERCIYSICDFKTFLRFNQTPCERMIGFLELFFSTSDSLAIEPGVDGSRLAHNHSRQYTFVLQSLTLWSEVMKEMLALWHKAEEDLLDKSNPYVCTQTGQGMQRVQKAPRVHLAMSRILAKVQKKLGGWIGSSTIHLGDANVPNALIFIDKYMQVPKILGPIVLCIDKIQDARNYSVGLEQVILKMGGADELSRTILEDFFKHGFDGSGGDTFFEAGSCVDGRLTSAWNWCSKIEDKSYYPVFQLTGFVGFD